MFLRVCNVFVSFPFSLSHSLSLAISHTHTHTHTQMSVTVFSLLRKCSWLSHYAQKKN